MTHSTEHTVTISFYADSEGHGVSVAAQIGGDGGPILPTLAGAFDRSPWLRPNLRDAADTAYVWARALDAVTVEVERTTREGTRLSVVLVKTQGYSGHFVDAVDAVGYWMVDDQTMYFRPLPDSIVAAARDIMRHGVAAVIDEVTPVAAGSLDVVNVGGAEPYVLRFVNAASGEPTVLPVSDVRTLRAGEV